MPPDNVGFENFSCAWVDYRWPHCVSFLGGIVCQYRVFHVVALGCHAVGVLFYPNGILKASPFKGAVPIQDATFDVRPKVAGYGVVYIKGDGFNGFYHFAAQVGGGVGGL